MERFQCIRRLPERADHCDPLDARSDNRAGILKRQAANRNKGMARNEGTKADNRVRVEFGGRGVNGAYRKVIDRQVLRVIELGLGVSGVTKQRAGADDGPGLTGRQIGLTYMQAETKESSIVSTVIQNQVRLEVRALLQDVGKITIEVELVANLNPVRASINGRRKHIDQSMAVEVRSIEDRVEQLFLDGGLVVRIGPR